MPWTLDNAADQKGVRVKLMKTKLSSTTIGGTFVECRKYQNFTSQPDNTIKYNKVSSACLSQLFN